MKKEFILNIILLLIINVLVKIFYLFFIEVNVQNTIGPEEYGIFLALFNFSYLFQFINDPGIQSYNTTSISSGRYSDHKGFSGIVGVKLIMALLYLGVVLAGGFMIGYHNEEWMYLLFLISINHILSTFFMLIRSTLSGHGFYRQDSLISALDKCFMILILGFLLFQKSKDFQLHDFIIGQMISYACAIISGIILLTVKNISIIPKISFRTGRLILRKSAPYALILLLMASYNKMDGVMIERLLPDGSYQAGIYAASLRFMDAANMGAYLFAGLLLPMFAQIKNDHKQLDELSRLSIKWMMTLVSVILVVGITYRKELMSIYRAIDDQYSQLLVFHLMSFGAVGISYVYGTLLTATGRLKGMNKILVLGLIVNLILNLTLIPLHLATGAAIATFVTQVIVMVGQLALSIKSFKLTIYRWDVMRILAMVGISMIIMQVWYGAFSIKWFFGAPIGAIAIVILAFLLGIIRKDMIFALFKKANQ